MAVGLIGPLDAGQEDATMRIGFSLFNNWGIEDVQCMVQLASWTEALGFDLVWVHDHVFNAGHPFDRIGGKPYYEPMTLLGYVAARTQRVGLGTAVLVLPYHHPVGLAKTVATQDVPSGGRLMMEQIRSAMDILTREVLPAFR